MWTSRLIRPYWKVIGDQENWIIGYRPRKCKKPRKRFSAQHSTVSPLNSNGQRSAEQQNIARVNEVAVCGSRRRTRRDERRWEGMCGEKRKHARLKRQSDETEVLPRGRYTTSLPLVRGIGVPINAERGHLRPSTNSRRSPPRLHRRKRRREVATATPGRINWTGHRWRQYR